MEDFKFYLILLYTLFELEMSDYLLSNSENDQNESLEESVHLHYEETCTEPEASDLGSPVPAPPRKKRIILPPVSDTESESDSLLRKKKVTLRRSPRKHTQTAQEKVSEETLNLDTEVSVQLSGKMIRTPRKSPRKRTRIPLSHMLQVLQESDEESDVELSVFTNKSQPVSGARPVRRSPRKTAQHKANRTEQMIQRSDQESDVPDSEIYTPARNVNQNTQLVRKSTGSSQVSTNVSTAVMKSNGKSVQGQLTNIQNTQKEILSTIKLLRKEVSELRRDFDKRKEESHEPISVPNRIRTAVKEYYANGEDMELKWDYQKRYYDDANAELTDFIKRKVKGVAPDVSNEVLDAAVKRYFTSKKEGANRKSRNKDTLHKQRQATYERKKEKVRRRLLSSEKKTNWPQEKKEAVVKLLKSKMSHKLMSSDEEGDDGFITHPYSWESETWRNIKVSLDKTYLKHCPPRSARLFQKRTRGSTKEQDKPDIDEEFSWIFE